MSNSGHLPPKNPERHRKVTIGRAATRTHLRAERTHGTGTLSQRVRDMPMPEDTKPAPLSDSNPGGLGLPSLAYPEHVQPLSRCRVPTTARRSCRVCLCLRAAVSHIRAYMVSPQAQKAATNTGDPCEVAREETFFGVRGCVHSAHSYSVVKFGATPL